MHLQYTVGVMLFHCKSPLLQPSGLAAKNLHHSTLLDASALNLKRKCTDKPGLHDLQRPAKCTSRLPQRLWPWFCSELVELCPVFAAFSSSAASSSSMLALSALWFSALVRMSGGTVRETLEDLGSISEAGTSVKYGSQAPDAIKRFANQICLHPPLECAHVCTNTTYTPWMERHSTNLPLLTRSLMTGGCQLILSPPEAATVRAV